MEAKSNESQDDKSDEPDDSNDIESENMNSTKASPDSPATGDNSNVVLWMILLMIAIIGSVVLVIFQRKKS